MSQSTFKAAVVRMEEALAAGEPVAYNYPSLLRNWESAREHNPLEPIPPLV